MSDNEITGPFKVPRDADSVNARTLFIAAALLLGSVGGNGAVSWFTGPAATSEKLERVERELQNLSSEVKRLNDVRVAVDDHEKRLRDQASDIVALRLELAALKRNHR